MPSFTLIYPIVWPRHTNVTDRQTDRQDRQETANRFPNGCPINEFNRKSRIVALKDKKSGDEIANVNFYAVRPEGT